MIVDSEEPRIIAYGQAKTFRPMARVVLFMLGLIVIIAVLTIARGFIFDQPVSPGINVPEGKNSEKEIDLDEGDVKEEKHGVVIKKDGYGNVQVSNVEYQPISYDISDLLESDMVKDLPNKAVISLKLGNEYYTVKKDSVSAGRPADPDLTISLPLSYAGQLSLGLCQMVKNANANKDLGIEMHASQTSLMWRYRGMLKYRDCLS